jgi:hypothetical protein
MVAARGQTSPSPVLTKLWTLLSMCAACCALMRHKGCTQSTQPACMGNGESHPTRHSSFQQRFRVNVWAGIIDCYIIGPYVIQNHGSGMHYTDLLKEMFQFRWRMRLYTCTRACGFSMMVPLPILHTECATDLTTLWTNGLASTVLSSEPPYIYICRDAWREEFMPLNFWLQWLN